MTINPLPSIILICAVIFCIAAYVVEGLALFRIGKKAGISWAWVAWIPGAQNFVMARMAKWKAWALFPTLTLVWAVIFIFIWMMIMGLTATVSMHHIASSITPVTSLTIATPMPTVSPMIPASSIPPTFLPGVLPLITIVIPVIELIVILFAVFTMIQWGQVLELFGYSYAWLMWNFLTVIGNIVFFVILLRIAFRKEVQYQKSGMRTVFGSLIEESGNSV